MLRTKRQEAESRPKNPVRGCVTACQQFSVKHSLPSIDQCGVRESESVGSVNCSRLIGDGSIVACISLLAFAL